MATRLGAARRELESQPGSPLIATKLVNLAEWVMGKEKGEGRGKGRGGGSERGRHFWSDPLSGVPSELH